MTAPTLRMLLVSLPVYAVTMALGLDPLPVTLLVLAYPAFALGRAWLAVWEAAGGDR